jgi:hypothetical protein
MGLLLLVNEFVLNNIASIIAICLIFSLLFYFFIKNISFGIGDPLVHLSVYSGFSISTLLLLEPYGSDSDNGRMHIVLGIVLFFLVLYLLEITNTMSKSPPAIDTLKENFIEYSNKVFGLITILAVVLFSVNTYFSLAMYGSIDGTAVIYAENRFIEIIKSASGYVIFFLFGAIISNNKKNNRKILVVIFFLVISAMFAGSKGYFINYASYFLFGYVFFGFKKLQVSQLLLFLILSLCSVFLLFYFKGYSLDESIQKFVIRLAANGDAYFHGLSELSIREYKNSVTLFDYLYHPFALIFGDRGYEHPLGVVINGLINGDFDSGRGPNAAYPLLALVSSDYLFEFYFYIVILAMIMYLFRFHSRFIFQKKSRSFFSWYSKIFYIVFSYTIPVIIFMDLGVALQSLLGGVLLYLAISIIYLSKHILCAMQSSQKLTPSKSRIFL